MIFAIIGTLAGMVIGGAFSVAFFEEGIGQSLITIAFAAIGFLIGIIAGKG